MEVDRIDGLRIRLSAIEDLRRRLGANWETFLRGYYTSWVDNNPQFLGMTLSEEDSETLINRALSSHENRRALFTRSPARGSFIVSREIPEDPRAYLMWLLEDHLRVQKALEGRYDPVNVGWLRWLGTKGVPRHVQARLVIGSCGSPISGRRVTIPEVWDLFTRDHEGLVTNNWSGYRLVLSNRNVSYSHVAHCLTDFCGYGDMDSPGIARNIQRGRFLLQMTPTQRRKLAYLLPSYGSTEEGQPPFMVGENRAWERYRQKVLNLMSGQIGRTSVNEGGVEYVRIPGGSVVNKPEWVAGYRVRGAVRGVHAWRG